MRCFRERCDCPLLSLLRRAYMSGSQRGVLHESLRVSRTGARLVFSANLHHVMRGQTWSCQLPCVFVQNSSPGRAQVDSWLLCFIFNLDTVSRDSDMKIAGSTSEDHTWDSKLSLHPRPSLDRTHCSTHIKRRPVMRQPHTFPGSF